MFLDLFIIIAIGYGAVRGYFKGFFIQSLTLVALIAGIWVGLKFTDAFAAWLLKVFHINEVIVPYVAFAIIFVAVIVVIHFIGLLLTKAIDKTIAGTLNKLGGLLFGALKMAFIVSVVLLLIQNFDRDKHIITETAMEKSFLYKPVAKIAPAVFPHLHFDKLKKGIIGS
jgi:membrane protein required for colicin V production